MYGCKFAAKSNAFFSQYGWVHLKLSKWVKSKLALTADRHAKKELKKRVRGIRPIEQSLEGKDDEESEAVRDYSLAVRAAITDDGHPPLAASGLKLHDRLGQIAASINGVAEKRLSMSSLFGANVRGRGKIMRRASDVTCRQIETYGEGVLLPESRRHMASIAR